MAVSGLPEACENHAKWIAKLALDMMDMAKCVQMGVEPVVSQIQHQNNNCYEMDYFFPIFFYVGTFTCNIFLLNKMYYFGRMSAYG